MFHLVPCRATKEIQLRWVLANDGMLGVRQTCISHIWQHSFPIDSREAVAEDAVASSEPKLSVRTYASMYVAVGYTLARPPSSTAGAVTVPRLRRLHQVERQQLGGCRGSRAALRRVEYILARAEGELEPLFGGSSSWPRNGQLQRTAAQWLSVALRGR